MSTAGTVAADHLRAFIERIERLEEEKKTLADDIKDIYAEAKGTGFDTKAIRAIVKLRKKDQAEREEEEAILDTYMAALGMLPLFDTDRSYADAKGRTESGPEVQVRDEVASSGAERTEGCYGTPARSVSDEILSANPPSASAPHTGLSSFPEHEVDASSGSIQSPAPTSSQAGDSAGEGVLPLSPATHSDDDVPAFLKRAAEPVLNERCANPDRCKFGHHPQKVTCATCSTAWAVASRKTAVPA